MPQQAIRLKIYLPGPNLFAMAERLGIETQLLRKRNKMP